MSNKLKRLIFVIDDEVSLAESIAMVFQVKGYQVKTFEAVAGALEKYMEGLNPVAIIIDGNLPVMSGPEGIQAFRLAGYTGEFIGISADDFEGEMLRAGAKSFWEKPIDMPGFVTAVEQIIEGDSSPILPA